MPDQLPTPKPTDTDPKTPAAEVKAAVPVKVVANETAGHITPAAEHPGAVASRKADQAATKDHKEPTHVSFGKLKLVGEPEPGFGVGVFNVTVEDSDDKTFTLQGVPARFLK